MLGLLQLSVMEEIAYFESTIIINELMNETVRHIFTKSDSEKKLSISLCCLLNSSYWRL